MSSDNEQPKEKTFQVVDKRRFDSSGHERTADSTPTSHSVTASSASLATAAKQTTTDSPSSAMQSGAASQFTIKDSPQTDEPEPVAFTSFVMSLATQVLVQLGEMPPPSGMEIPLDLEAARQTIDIMTMLQRRTRGNLSAEEAHFMEEVLHSLRVSYINAKKKAS
jgi:hypothetical protein